MMETGSRRRFVGETMNEAIGAMRETLGRDALLVSSNKVRHGGLFGVGGREIFEVVGVERPYTREERRTRGRRAVRRPAASSSTEAIEQILAAAEKERGRRRPARWESAAPIQLELFHEGEAPTNAPGAGLYGRSGSKSGRRREAASSLDRHLLADPRSRRDQERTDVDCLRDEIAALKDEFRTVLSERLPVSSGAVAPAAPVADPSPSSPIVESFRRRMIESGLPADLAARVADGVIARSTVEELADASIMRARFRKEAAALIEVAAPLEPHTDRPLVIFAIGPTGVGKTTTLAKLGAIFSEEESRRIAFVTIDHYRVAAAEQLRTYSEILGVPFEEAAATEELKDAIGRHMDKDVILVDTAGRSPFATDGIEEIRRMREEIGIESEALLFVSSTTSLEQMENVIGRFRPADSARLVFTKVDETSQWGPLFAAAVRSALPIAYATNGQSVPFDIEPARAVRFAEAILGEDRGR